MSITDPTRRIINRNHQRQLRQGKKIVHCISYKKSTTPATQPMRKHHPPRLSLSSNGLSLRTTHTNFLLLLHKIMFLFFVCCNCLWFCYYSLHVPNHNSVLFLNEPTFAGKITYCFIFGLTAFITKLSSELLLMHPISFDVLFPF